MLLPGADEIDLTPPLADLAEQGFARLGPVMNAEALSLLRDRADAIMLGETNELDLFYQHDSGSGRYEDLEYGQGWRGPSPRYRKIEKLERDPHFLAWIENGLFARIARALLGETVTVYRAVLWNKAVQGGTSLPWHQDDGPFWGIDRRPSLQIWTALDDAPPEAGCMEVLPASHLGGLATPDGGTVPDDLISQRCGEDATTLLPAKAGESILLHNHTWHRSGRNSTNQPRRAMSISFLSGDTRCTRKRRAPREFHRVFE